MGNPYADAFPLDVATRAIIEGEVIPLAAAMAITESLQEHWDQWENPYTMRRWLWLAGAIYVDELGTNLNDPSIRCTAGMCRAGGVCVPCCRLIRKRFPVPPTLAELLAARAR